MEDTTPRVQLADLPHHILVAIFAAVREHGGADGLNINCLLLSRALQPAAFAAFEGDVHLYTHLQCVRCNVRHALGLTVVGSLVKYEAHLRRYPTAGSRCRCSSIRLSVSSMH